MGKFIDLIMSGWANLMASPQPQSDALRESSATEEEVVNNYKTKEKLMGDTMNGLDLDGLGALVEGLKANPHMTKSIWYAKSEWKGGFACDVSSRNFNWKIDEPTDLGGTDVAANPVEMYLGALLRMSYHWVQPERHHDGR